jgi:Protein of unknown function (DUF3426).
VILSCPSCSAQYFADDKAIGENGRTVRCAACGHSWFAKPELSLEQQFDDADFSREKVERARQASSPETVAPHQAYREKEFARRSQGSRVAALAAWTGCAAVFFGLGAGAVVKRDDIVKYWPQSATAYAMAGLETNRFGLEFGPVDAERTFDGTTPILTLSGAISNNSGDFQSVPVVRIDLRDDQGKNVDSVMITLNEDVLAPGKESRFSTRIDNPPLEAFDLAMSFVQPARQDIRLAKSVKEHKKGDVKANDHAQGHEDPKEHAKDAHDDHSEKTHTETHEKVDPAPKDDHDTEKHDDGHH